MAHCYRCGRYIKPTHKQLRRRVSTGEHRLRPSSKSSVTRSQAHFGMRIVCRLCAQTIDREKYLASLFGHVHVLIALLILVVILIFARR